jgi:hypothetical protein
MTLAFPNSEMVLVTVQPNKTIKVDISGVLVTHIGGDTFYVNKAEAVYLRRDGIIV